MQASTVYDDGDIARRQRQAAAAKHASLWQTALRSFRRHWQLYLIMLPGLLYFVIFRYIPMVNAVIAFKDYNVVKGIWGSPWVGLQAF